MVRFIARVGRFVRILAAEALEDLSLWIGELADRVDPYFPR